MLGRPDFAIDYIKKHAKDDKPFFMDVNFMHMHNPTNPATAVRRKDATRTVFGFGSRNGLQRRPDHR
jgi:hypothetical protein